MKKKINYDETLLTIQCHRKHFILDSKYFAQVLPDCLIISSSVKEENPKYILELQLSNQIHWITKNKTSIIEQFGFSFQGNIKYFFGQSDDLNKLKTLLQCQIMYKEISDFYSPINLLGKGGSAKVYLVSKKGSYEKFASKCVDKRYLQEDGGYDALVNEIKIMQALKHQNIIKLVDLYEGESTFYLILEYLGGESLCELFTRRQSILEQNQIQIIMKQILEAVQFMHSQGIMHRDLKPENIMFKSQNQYDQLKIVDFGLATFSSVEELPFPKCGTPGYVAPEIANLRDLKCKYDLICDEFSIGCIFYKLCTNKELFVGQEYKEILKLNKRCLINLDSLAIYRTPPEACDLIQQFLKINPKERISAKDALNHQYFKMTFETKKQKFQSANLTKQNPVFQTQNFKHHCNLNSVDDDYVEDENCNQLQVPVMGDLKSLGLLARQPKTLNTTTNKKVLKKSQTQEFDQSKLSLTAQKQTFKPSFIMKSEQDQPEEKKEVHAKKHCTLIKNFPKLGELEQMSKIDEDFDENHQI